MTPKKKTIAPEQAPAFYPDTPTYPRTTPSVAPLAGGAYKDGMPVEKLEPESAAEPEEG